MTVQPDDTPDVTHKLFLADGSSVDSSGAIPTQVAQGDGVVPVVHAMEV